jgi:hypothetical protein
MVVHTLARGAIFLPSRYAFESLRHCISSLLLNEMNQAFVCQKKRILLLFFLMGVRPHSILN